MSARAASGQTLIPCGLVPVSSRRFSLLLAVVLAVPAADACDRSPKSSPAPVESASAIPRDPLAAIHLDDSPIDWSRPIPTTPPGGLTEPGYAGSEACKDCHKDLYLSYERHSMARTGPRPLATLDRKWLDRIFDAGASQPVVHELSGFTYRPFRKGRDYFVEELVLADDGARVQSWTEKLDYSYSAGSYGMAFYFRQGNRLYQIPIDYYAKAERWGIDPAATVGNTRFSKPMGSFCIACHADYPRRPAGTDDVFLDPLPTGVGCERCHGPGAKHAQSLRAADIVNPARLSTVRQLDVCAQCHESSYSQLRADRGEFSYRPGEPLGAYRVNFVGEPPEPDRLILLAHPERMVRSACWKGLGREARVHERATIRTRAPSSSRRRGGTRSAMQCHGERHVHRDRRRRARRRTGALRAVPHARGVAVEPHAGERHGPLDPEAAAAHPAGERSSPTRLVAWPDLVGDPAHGRGPDRGRTRPSHYAERSGSAPRRTGARWRASVARGRGCRSSTSALAGRYGGGEPALERGARVHGHFSMRFAPDAAPMGSTATRVVMLDRGPSRRAVEATHALDRLLALDAEDPSALETKGTVPLPERTRIEEATAALRARAAARRTGERQPRTWRSARWRDARGATRTRSSELEAARRIEPGLTPGSSTDSTTPTSKAGDAAHTRGHRPGAQVTSSAKQRTRLRPTRRGGCRTPGGRRDTPMESRRQTRQRRGTRRRCPALCRPRCGRSRRCSCWNQGPDPRRARRAELAGLPGDRARFLA
jgi:hypothetical protein